MRPHVPVLLLTLVLTAGAVRRIPATAPPAPPAAASPTFAEHIAPIVIANCVSCHRPGGAAPFSLLTYEDVRKRGRQIAGVTEKRIMPPWHADRGTYAFRDERRLSEADIAAFRRWVDGGMPEGKAALTPAAPSFPSGWQLGPPDLIVELPVAWTVPADGPDIYRNFVVPVGLKEDQWVRAIDLRPTARSVVHHVLYFSDTTGAARRADDADPEPGYQGMRGGLRNTPLGGWAMGQQPHAYPDGVALPFPKGADLILQFHFHPSGRSETERARIGLYFADRAPARTLVNLQLPVLFGFFAGIDIPAGEPRFRVRDSFVLPVDVEGVAIGAHAHYLGRRMTMGATPPGGSRQTLLSISNWDFAWQDRYFFEQLASLPAGTRLDVEIEWDNSADNPANPSDPPVRVTWGEQSRDEMGSVTLQVLPRRQSDLESLQTAYRSHVRDAVRSNPTALLQWRRLQ
jgi:hypothetical protein